MDRAKPCFAYKSYANRVFRGAVIKTNDVFRVHLTVNTLLHLIDDDNKKKKKNTIDLAALT